MLNRWKNWVLLAAQPKVPTGPISISSSDNEHSNDLAYAPIQLVGEVKVEPSSSEALLLDKCKGKELAAGPSQNSKKKERGTSSADLPSLSVHAELWKPEFSTVKLIMLPNDVANLVEESSEEIRNLLVMQQVQAKLDFEAVEEMLEKKADEVPKKDLEMAGKLDQEEVAAAIEDGATAEEASPNLSLDL
ncbi:hypothetical protein Acr_13g0005680 [Actinidia rufa]|uniref:Uncharacterized protein n=1 Tax=Actinidia rufa TaxID=165716 RepID=A0A7J0FMK1_9ERIC|nr:hypothetical protein Acr_13g0005680 [Actinidia rufa]